jgi:hypothetical protein
MAELLQLDAAAKLVGKSEVTLRRLVKAGKVNAQKEKTLTGFIYLIDAEEVRKYYGVKKSAQPTPRHTEKPAPQADQEEEQRHAVESKGRVRVAVSGDQGDPVDYWLKRAETYEERYHRELQKTSELREELGLWRGRAEHAHSLLIKLIPAPNTVEIGGQKSVPHAAPAKTRRLTPAGFIVLVGLPLILILGGALMYLIRIS